MTRDQNGNIVRPNTRKVRHADGRVGWITTVWFGSNPATEIRDHVYESIYGAKLAAVCDDYRNSDMIAFNVRRDDWQPIK